ncbi:MAG: thiamine phosphate synthase [Candidatus Omnitrophica bacterium]|nr:thiamine phosphate synthase [Candidatus Omnitrophota bacterium]
MADLSTLFDAVKASKKYGVDIVQLRDKLGTTREALKFAKKIQEYLKGRILFIVNDRVDVALLANASGVHVGQGDIPVCEARKILGPRKIIGTSCQTLEHVMQAHRDGADYIGFGSVFKTETKPERAPMELALLKKAALKAEGLRLPLFAIGGITRANLSSVLACNVNCVAVCREILKAKSMAVSVGNMKHALTAGL